VRPPDGIGRSDQDRAGPERRPVSMDRPPYDPELEPLLDLTLQSRPESGPTDLAGTRRVLEARFPTIESIIDGRDLEHVQFRVPGPTGAPDITLSVIRRPGRPATPCIYNIHGGGMMFLNRFAGAEEFVVWIERFDVSVVTVEYRLAPEHPHPAPVEDCYAGLVWVAEHGVELGIDPSRILVHGGSAGGGLTAAVALMARDLGGPALIGQVLRCPMLDDRDRTVSTLQFDNRTIWNRSDNVRGWSALLGDARGTPDVSPYGAPARSEDFSGLPPAFLDVGSAEVFRDETVEYATRIWAAGGQAELHVWSGGFHGFEHAEGARVSQGSYAARYNWMDRILRP
jgi:acetyl esterase/lipase